jgi:peptidoglycan/xylan/chitin deacetylase (PgdA/CDA1 family)
MEGAWLGAAGLASAAGFLGFAARGRSAAIFGSSVYRGDRTRPSLALTFDDGPSESTPELLEVLAKHDARATFFMCGANVRRCPGIAAQVCRAGHEIGNHTDTHARLDFRSAAFIFGEMARAQETIREATGAAPRWFRAPYGVRWFGVGAAQRRLGLTGAMWTLIARDWRLAAASIERRLLRGGSNGAILCLHDGRGIAARPDIRATVTAVDRVIPLLKERGLRFETLSEMICPQPALT